jgi:hypothetical protein
MNSRVTIASCIVVSQLSTEMEITGPLNIAPPTCAAHPTEVRWHTTLVVGIAFADKSIFFESVELSRPRQAAVQANPSSSRTD